MNGLITCTTTLQSLYSTPGVAKVRISQKQVSTGTAVIDSLRTFGPSSLTFVVTAQQHLVTSHGTTNGSAQYAITVTGSGTSWQVNDIEPSDGGPVMMNRATTRTQTRTQPARAGSSGRS